MSLYALIGGILGLLAGVIAHIWTGHYGSMILFGGLIGYLVGWVRHLSIRLKNLESEREITRSSSARVERVEEEVREPQQSAVRPSSAPAKLAPTTSEPARPAERVATGPAVPARADTSAWAPGPTRSEPKEERAPAASASAFDRAVAAAREWFTSGNVPVMVGVVLALLGAGFFIKYAIDRHLFSFPMWARLAATAVFGLVMFGIGWRLRVARRNYALCLQGGGMAIFYLTTYAAFEFYDLLPATVAFASMVVVTVVTGVAAVQQDSRVLIVLGIAGGFLAPLLAATETGNHVVLFSYYAVLNAAILTVALFKAWRALNLLGFAFTFVIASFWGYQGYRPEHFATTEPFLVLFVLMYIGIAVLFARQRPPNLRGFVDSALVFGPPLIGFALQTRLVENDLGLAASAGALAAVYATLAATIWRTSDLRALVWSFAGLALLFLTVAFPLALDERWTAAVWAVQGGILAWFGMRNGSRVLPFVGALLQVAAGVSYILQPGSFASADMPVLNGYFLGGVLMAAVAWTIGWCFDHDSLSDSLSRLSARLALGWGGAWWLWAGIGQIAESVSSEFVSSAVLGFVAVSAIGAGLASRPLGWQRCNALALVLLPTMALVLVDFLMREFVLTSVDKPTHPLANFGWLAWPLALGVQYAFLRFRESGYPQLVPYLHVGSYWVLAVLVAMEAWGLVGMVAQGDWPVVSGVVAVAVLTVAARMSRPTLSWPLQAHWPAYSMAAIPVVAVGAAIVIFRTTLTSPGAVAPLPYLPLVNALTIASGVAGIAVWHALDADWRRREARLLTLVASFVGLVLLSMEVARGVHHFAGVPFTVRDLGGSAIFQAGLSLVWGGAGLAGMILGAVRERRGMWIGGAVIMAVVIVKLFVVELGNVGTLSRVVSFLGVGVLLLVVGYFAPVPKGRRVEAASNAAGAPAAGSDS